mgnify:CR=1 FL=1
MVIGSGLLKDGIMCHIVCAASAGFTATVIGSPVDVLKTRIMSAPAGTYSNPMQAIT